MHLKHCGNRRVGAGTVVLAVAENHRAVQTHVAGLTGRYNFQLCRFKIFFFYSVHLFQKGKNSLFAFFFKLFLFFFCKVVAVYRRNRTHDYIQVFTLNKVACLFLHLVLGKVRKNIRNAENRFVVIFADYNIYRFSVLLYYYTVNCQWNSCPLVFFDSAIVVGVHIGNVVFFVERILLCIQTRGVYVGAENVHTLFNRLKTDFKKSNCFVHLCDVNLVPRAQFLKFRNIFVAVFIGHLDNLFNAFTFCFSVIQKVFVIYY